jgi:integrase
MPHADRALTQQSDVFALPLPKGRAEIVYFDEGKAKDKAHGLGLRIREGGSRKWVYFYRWNGKQQKLTIGDANNDPNGWTLARARSRATELRVMLNDGKNPNAERQKLEAHESSSKTFRETVTAYLAAREPHMKPRTYADNERFLEKFWKPFHNRAVHEIDVDMVADRLKEIETQSGPVAHNRSRSALSAMYTWAIGRRFSRHLRVSPVDGTVKVDEARPRDRVLSDEEIVKIWKAAPDNNYGRILKLLMLTGQRRHEIGSLQWSEVNGEKNQLELPPERTKNSRPHDVPLSNPALDILSAAHRIHGYHFVFGRRGFNDWSKAKAELDKVCGVKGWTVHDLRRTAATKMSDLGVQPHIVEAVLNHVSGHKAGVAGVYNKSDYTRQIAVALARWSEHVLALVEGRQSKVVALQRA